MTDGTITRVGYKRPPEHSRFKPGQSGNPAGRPKGTLNLETDLVQELSERIAVREGDRQLKISKQRAMLKAMVAKALKGDTRAAGLILQLVAKAIGKDDDRADLRDAGLSEDETAILERFVARRAAGNSKTKN